MKLYATTTSERASKGQGGNDYLDIEILNESQYPIMQIHAKPFGENGLIHAIIRIDGQEKILWAGYLKGKSQKGEKCYKCSAVTKTSLKKWHCSNCGQDN
jgi:hypothetical protein